MQITLRNDYHGTEYNIRYNGPLTPAQVQRCRKHLCGIPACTCGGLLGEHGPQPVDIEIVGGKIVLRPLGMTRMATSLNRRA